MKKIIWQKHLIWMLLITFCTHAQVGIGTTVPNGALDITSTNDGLLIPRVALVNTTTVTVVTGTTSELVYNTVTSGDVTPGFYYLSSATGPWVRLATGGSAWQVTGNTNIVNNVNFMGTGAGNNADVAFRRNNSAAGRISSTSTSFGVGALTSGSASNSSAFGNNALTANTTGAGNVAVGTGALAANTTTANNTGIGFNALLTNTASDNTALGYRSMAANTTGNQNVAAGFNSLAANTQGSQNVSVGHLALATNSNSLRNTAIGYRSMTTINSSAWVDNVAIGWGAMADAASGTRGTFIGVEAGRNNTGSHSVAIGRQALGSNNGGPSSGIDNVAIGHQALSFNTTGQQNAAVGAEAMTFSTSGRENSVLGYRAGNSITVGNQNTAIGYRAGSSTTTGSGNVFIGYFAGQAEAGASSNKLYISNSASNATTSLIYGEFGPSRILRTNSLFQIGDPVGTGYQFPVARGTNNQVLQTNATGELSWANPSSLAITEIDPQVSSTTANAIPRWDGTTLVDGSITDDGTNVTVAGNTTTTTFQMTNGANPNYILQSDAAGNATWVPNPLTTLSAMRITVSANQALAATGWQKINFDTTIFDTKSEFAGGTFTAATAGIYQVNAGMHTSDQNNGQFYSIGVYVNGALYQETTGNHFGNGPVHRNINCMVNLAAGGFVEIYVQNYQAGVQVDSFPTKTFFEVQQIR